ncbi:heavy-metal-associated domain-containing protein [Tetragenococcus halophilus]|uniref:heavy-metal-associated domain-containing protein n=1 Tax=Tetragenococcus halophilus TaxID=51669 RepID=UPI001F3C8298|nr:heavy-metal-associated domain-containing protein [Tetragenococcus halophilus]MCF1686062.1 heavy-metal-associated domain-containing protein [Tetragenococcus halophilus]
MNTNTYSVPDMSCAHCKMRIEKEVNKLTGIQNANANPEEKKLTVTFDTNDVQSEDIVNAVSEAGYTAEKA